jgi:hypothetical protein
MAQERNEQPRQKLREPKADDQLAIFFIFASGL